jgi:exodeoxyribonuclease-3
MKIVSCNVNGIRSAYKKGFLDFVKSEKPDIVCLQEIKARSEDFPQELLDLKGYFSFINPAEKRGYSGVAVFTKEKPISVSKKLGLDRFDKEGRLLELEYDDFILLNLYFPHGGRQKENLDYKLEVYRKVFERIKRLKNKNIILIGDFNIAHEEIDLARPKENKNNIMFSPEERSQIDKLTSLGFVDSFRQFNNKTGKYTWWPYAFNAKERNMGWRIDYAFISQKLKSKLIAGRIFPKVKCSDHCPIGVEFR